MHKSSQFWGGFLLILLGFLFLLRNFYHLDVGEVLRTYWPVILVLLGIRLLLKEPSDFSGARDAVPESSTDSAPPFTKTAGASLSGTPLRQHIHELFGEIRRNYAGQEIRFLNVTNLLGEIELDFGEARFEDQALVRISNVLGDVKIKMPPAVALEIRSNYLAGSSEILGKKESGFFKNIIHREPVSPSGKTPVQLNISLIIGNIKISH